MRQDQILNEVAQCLLSLDSAFSNFDFFHLNLLSPSKKKMSPEQAYSRLQSLLQSELLEISDHAPQFRRTYIHDLIVSVLAQYDLFIRGKRAKVSRWVELLYGAKLPQPFNLRKEWKQLSKECQVKGYDLAELVDIDQRERVYFKKYSHLKNELLKEYQVQLKKASFILKKKVADRSKLLVFEPGEGELPHSYQYQGGFQGRVGLKFRDNFRLRTFQTFILHEICPGHHLYYLLRQALIESSQGDSLHRLDPFYSPENVVNEGLAVNADLILADRIDFPLQVYLRREKLAFKAFYNIWYSKYVRKLDCKSIRGFLLNDLRLSQGAVSENEKLFLGTLKYYMPVYPLGIKLIETILNNKAIHKTDFMWLYLQHSYNSVKKMEMFIPGRKEHKLL